MTKNTDLCIYCGERRRENGSLLCGGCYRTWFKRLKNLEDKILYERKRQQMERYWSARVRR